MAGPERPFAPRSARFRPTSTRRPRRLPPTSIFGTMSLASAESKPAPRAAFVGAGRLGGKFGRVSSAVCSDRRARTKAPPRAAEPAKAKSAAAPAKPAHTTTAAKKPAPIAGRSEDCERGCGQTFAAAKAGSERRVAEQRDHDHQPAQRGLRRPCPPTASTAASARGARDVESEVADLSDKVRQPGRWLGARADA